MNIENILEKIKKDFSKKKITKKYNLAIMNYLKKEFVKSDKDWEKKYINEFDWYKSLCVRDVEDDITTKMIRHGRKKYNFKKKFSYEEFLFLENKLCEYYKLN